MVVGFVIVGLVLGSIAGAMIEELGAAAFWGALWGAGGGYLVARLRQTRRAFRRVQDDLTDIQARLAGLEWVREELRAKIAPVAEKPEAAALPPSPAAAGIAAYSAADHAGERGVDPSTSAESHASETWIDKVRVFLLGGNTLARVGILVLLVGVALLAKYAVDHAVFPVELRLTGAALVGLALIVIGWRLRERRRGYATILQGGGVGSAYLTVFFALRVYHLIPAPIAFAILAGLALFSGALAVLQNALALAIVSTVAGFLAPIVASTGSGNHVVLFSYYLLLNAVVVGVALFRSWRSLNLLGFFFTFGVGATWGATRYAPEDFATTEPFLIAFFLFYVGIAILHAWRQPPRLRGFVDGTLVFGTPLVSFSMQALLVHDTPFAMAWSAVALAIFYIGLGSALFKRAPVVMRNMVEGFLALGVVFGTLAIPLALDDHHLTATSWALEGAGLVWLGLRQRRLLPRLSGVLLQLAAGLAFAASDVEHGQILPLVNSHFVGCVMLALAALFIAASVHRRRQQITKAEPFVGYFFIAWGLIWWLTGGATEIVRLLETRWHLSAWLGLVVLTALCLEAVGRRVEWGPGRATAALLTPTLLGFVVAAAVGFEHPLAEAGFIAWPLTLAAAIWIHKRHEDLLKLSLLGWLHAVLLWVFAILATWEAAYWTHELVALFNAWPVAMMGTMPSLIVLAVLRLARGRTWPVAKYAGAFRLQGLVPLIAFLVFWGLVVNLSSRGDAWPLPYLPLVGPLDVGIGLGFVAVLAWYAGIRDQAFFARLAPLFSWGVAAAAFFWINAMLVRTVHRLTGVPFQADLLYHSTVLQSSISIFWASLSLAAMVLASRRRWRPVWIAAACLIGVDVLKLFLIDLAFLGTAARIISFLAVGALLLLVGYVSPVPPRASSGPAQPHPSN